MKPWPLDTLVDLDRYPIHMQHSARGAALVQQVREALSASGACDLPGFMRPAAVEASVADALAVRGHAYRTQSTHDIEFSGLPRESFARDDPRQLLVRSAKEGTAFDRIPEQCPVRTLYANDHMLRFVGAALEVDPLYRSEDPLGALNLMYYPPGDELGWHFDNADFVVTLMLQPSRAGGMFEYVPMLRSEADRNDAGVHALLAGRHPGVRATSASAGTLALFRGHYSPHRVTPVEGDIMRINAVLSYARRPGHRPSDKTYSLFYGRKPDALRDGWAPMLLQQKIV